MEKPFQSLDWSLVAVFLAVAETGSLSAAARALRSSQPTVGRQVREIEERLGTAVFQRQPRGMALTEAGAALLDPARAMREAAAQFETIAAGAREGISGTVRITVSETIAQYVMPQILADLRQAEPEISIDLVSTDDANNLLFREADIAVRMFRPTQLDLITQHVGVMPIRLFGAKTYFQRKGFPAGVGEVFDHDFIGYDEKPGLIEGFRERGFDVDRDFFVVRCDSHPVMWELVRAGLGLGFAPRFISRGDTTVQEVPIEVDLPVLEVWLTAHSALRGTPRIRRVWTLLAEGLKPFVE